MSNEHAKSTSALFKLLENSTSIEDFIQKNDDEMSSVTFLDYLKKFLTEIGFTIPEVSQRSYMNEPYCYQLFNGTRKPSRDKIIQLSFGLKLSLEQTNKLLRAGKKNELYCRDKRDAVIIFGINKQLQVIDVEEMLLQIGLESLLHIE